MLSASLASRCVPLPNLPGCSRSPLRTRRRRTRRVERPLSSDRVPGDDALRLERGRVKSEATRVLGVLRGLLAAETTLLDCHHLHLRFALAIMQSTKVSTRVQRCNI